jgi:hypothetical protein
LPAEPLPVRTVAEVQEVLQRSDGPTLLGGTQALVDGGRLVFERSTPDTDLLRRFWKLLPASTRCRLWPASFAFGNALGFHVLVVPRIHPDEWDTTYAGYLREEQAGDYPEGRYELDLQTAAEAGDQRELNALFLRRSGAQTVRLALYILVVAIGLGLVIKLLSVFDQPPAPPPAATPTGIRLPPPGAYPSLNEPDRQRMTEALRKLADLLGVGPEPTSAQELLTAIDDRLGTPAGWPYGRIQDQGPVQRQLRVLLLKHRVPDYDDARLNEAELVERLQAKVLTGKGNRD